MKVSPQSTLLWRPSMVITIAHLIRQGSNMLARAVFALNASCRWAVTGTPVQNRLTDLASLFEFLQFHPFDDPETFKHHVMRDWKTRSDPQALARLKLLINSITIRRPKREVILPHRTDQVHPLVLDPDEREHYDNVRNNTLQEIDAVIAGSEPRSSLNALQLITTLRLICNHGVVEKQQTPLDLKTELDWGVQSAQRAFESLRDSGQANCMHCRQDVAFMTDVLDCEDTTTTQPRVSRDLRLLCAPCSERGPQTLREFLPVCNHPSKCSSSFSSGSNIAVPSSEDNEISIPQSAIFVSTKIKSLLTSLLENESGYKRFVQQ